MIIFFFSGVPLVVPSSRELQSDNHLIRRVVIATGAVTTFAGSSGNYGYDDGTATLAKFKTPKSISIDPVGGVFALIADCTSLPVSVRVPVVSRV